MQEARPCLEGLLQDLGELLRIGDDEEPPQVVRHLIDGRVDCGRSRWRDQIARGDVE